MLKRWRPRVCVVMGGDQWYWLKDLIYARTKQDVWRIDNEVRIPRGPDWGSYTTLRWNDDGYPSTYLIAAYHYSARRVSVARKRSVAQLAANKLGELLAQAE